MLFSESINIIQQFIKNDPKNYRTIKSNGATPYLTPTPCKEHS